MMEWLCRDNIEEHTGRWKTTDEETRDKGCLRDHDPVSSERGRI